MLQINVETFKGVVQLQDDDGPRGRGVAGVKSVQDDMRVR